MPFPTTLAHDIARFNLGTTWQVGCGGLETPFTYGGRSWLYVWDGTQHGYLDLATDAVFLDYRDGYREVIGR